MKKFSPFEVAESESIKSASCKALERHVPGVLGAKATQQDTYFMPSDHVVPCKLRVLDIHKSTSANPCYLTLSYTIRFAPLKA